MTKAQKIILLAAATLILGFILHTDDPSPDFIMVIDGEFMKDEIPWDLIIWIAVIAGAAFLIAGKRSPGGRE